MKERSRDSFIEMLVEETYQFLPSEDTSLDSGSLSQYFCDKNEALSGNQSEETVSVESEQLSFELNFLEEIGCFRLQVADGTLIDFPMNWSIFNSIHKAAIGNLTESFSLKDCEDLRQLEQILCGFTGDLNSGYFYVSEGNVYYIAERDEGLEAPQGWACSKMAA